LSFCGDDQPVSAALGSCLGPKPGGPGVGSVRLISGARDTRLLLHVTDMNIDIIININELVLIVTNGPH
jgi:hypothetical protein